MKFLIFLIAVLLTGCSAIEEMKDEKRIERAEATCNKMGLTKGTSEYQNCVTQMVAARSTRR